MLLGNKLNFGIISLIILNNIMFSMAYGRSIYVITDYHSTIKAYDIQGDQIVEQKTVENLADHGGAVGLALDPDSKMLFVTYEGSNIIEMVNAKTMISEENPVTVTGSYSLSGIAFDYTKKKLYVLERQDNRLYVYLWNSITKILTLEGDTYKTLENIGSYPNGAYGIAIDENKERLYVSNATSTVHYYDTNSWNHVDSVDVSRGAVGIAVDPNRQYLYTGSFSGYEGGHTFLVRTDISDINNPTFDEYPVGAYVIGLTTDVQTGLVYITDKSNEIKIFNTATFPSDPCEYADPYFNQLRDIIVRGNVSYKPPFPLVNLVKDDNDVDCVSPLISEAEHELLEVPYNWLYYTIEYDANGFADTNVIITDYLPVEVDYYSSSSDPCGYYDPNTHTVTWNIGDMSASDSNTFWIQVGVNYYARPGYTITNYCEIESDEYCTFAIEDTNICCYGDNIIYVNQDANDPNSFHNGTSWLDAYTDLQEALHAGRTCGFFQIWVAEGTYKPTKRSDIGARLVSFELPSNVGIYGGFPNTGDPNWYDRDWHTHITTLSGDVRNLGDKSDNSYHVVKCVDVNNAVLDGFTITAGNANATGIDETCGAGIFCMDSNNLIVRNCTICQNGAEYNGGYGGGIYYLDSTNLTLEDCNLAGNTACFGGAICNYNSDQNITDCIFNTNDARRYGGVIYCGFSSPKITNSIFNGNTVSSQYSAGGGMYNEQSSPTLINCTFSGNSAITGEYYTYTYGGAIFNYNYSHPNITNCTFSENSAREGGAVYNFDHSDSNISNCVFNGNTAESHGGGMVNSSESSPAIINCIFSGNSATTVGNSHGGAICNWVDSDPDITNCTFSENSAYQGGAVYNNSSDPNITNCILWNNVEDEIYIDASSNPDISYSDIKGGWTGGTGNIDKAPCFFVVEPATGSWTADPSYDESTFQSTLTDDSASWTVNQLAGKFINPDTANQDLHFFIVSNDVNTINVWSDVESFVISGDPYQIYDYHLKVESPCIDAGDPCFNPDPNMKDIDGEPRVFDGDYNDTEVVDMGADEYYWSPADFNSDGLVDFFDYALIAGAWLTIPTSQYYNDAYDLIDNNCIDSNDLARFCEDWLWQTAWAKTFPFAYYQAMGRGMDKSTAESLGLTQDLFTSVSAKQPQPELTADDIEEIIKWLADLWLTEDELRKIMSEDEWLKFIDQVIELAKQEIQY